MNRLTVEQVQERVRDIEHQAHNDEAAHSDEDALYRTVLRAIAEGAPNAPALAAAALKTSDIDFARWCA